MRSFSYREYLAKKNAVPVALGSKEIPEGAPNCLADLAFVFTGDLPSMTRDQATDLIKRYGGRVTGAPSKKTSFVVVGENPGPSKMDKIRDLGLRIIDEDGLLGMIKESNPSGVVLVVTQDGPVAEAGLTEAKVEPVKITKQVAKKTEEQLRSLAEPDPFRGSQLWADKYAPKSSADLIGNPGIYEKLRDWLSNWDSKSSETRATLL